MSNQDEQLAAFWCNLLKPLFSGETPSSDAGGFFRRLASQTHTFPDGSRRKPSQSTLWRKWKQYRNGGAEALRRKRRSDCGKPRKATQPIIERAIELKMEQRDRSHDEISQILRAESRPTVSKSTLYRYLTDEPMERMAGSRTMLVRKIRRILPEEKELLRRWRRSSNKKLWDKAVTILDSGDSTVEEICAKIERSSRWIYRWVRTFNEHGVQAVNARSVDWSESSKAGTTAAGQVRTVLPKERKVLEQWRNSGNKTLWDKAVAILESGDSTVEEICAKTDRSQATIYRWVAAFNERGIEGITRKSRDRTKSNKTLKLKTTRIFEILHAGPRSFGINRSNWTLATLATAYEQRHGETIGRATVGRLIKVAGYRFRKARRVLTSPDPDYREKVELLLQTLQSLKPDELFFFVDELGPLRVKSYGGRCYAPKRKPLRHVCGQTSRGSVTLSGALSATTNQVTWFYAPSKDTQAMIDLAEILFNQYHDKSRLYITWDAASWHSSNVLTCWLDAFNAQSGAIGNGPIIELVPLPSQAQFLDVIESVFSGMKRAVIHHSNYVSECEMKTAISAHFMERNEFFELNPRRAGRKIWEADFFDDFKNVLSGDYREW